MKKLLLLPLICFGLVHQATAQTKIKDGTVSSTSLPNSNAILDLESNNKGLLLPRVALLATTNPSPLSAHVAGMTVYNTAKVADVDTGLYYNDGTKWGRLVTTANPSVATAKASLLFYDDTTNVFVAGVGTSPNGTSYAGLGSYGLPIGSYITPAASGSIDSVKKVGVGIYKIFFRPGLLPDANYSLAVTSTDGLAVAGDDGWQVCNAPYTTKAGSSLYAACARENETLIPANGGTPAHYITRKKDYCYIITTYGGSFEAAYVSFILFR